MAGILIYGEIPPGLILPSREIAEVIITKNPVEVRRRVHVDILTMIILDMEEKEQTAMELARYIRNVPLQAMTPILFLACSHELEWEAFHDLHCYDYLIKPLTFEDVMKIMYLCIQRLEYVDPERKIVFTSMARKYPININDILYIESIKHGAIVHTTSLELRVPSLRLTSFMRNYGNDFLQIHRSVVVNRRQIRCINPVDSFIELKNGRRTLAIGRTYLSAVRKAFDGY